MRVSEWARTVVGYGRRAFDSILPPVCVACSVGLEADSGPVCPRCRLRLPRINPPRCPTCGVTRTGPPELAPAASCAECEDWEGLRAAAPFRMTGLAADLVHALKYKGWHGLAPMMASTMRLSSERLAGGEPQLLAPVPLAAARLRERGFNQALLLAAGLANETGWPLVNPLRRRRTGEQQARLGRRRRVQNVKGLFLVDRGCASASPPVLLVDDVVTTGATAAECRRVLVGAGFRCTGVVSFARAARTIDDSE